MISEINLGITAVILLFPFCNAIAFPAPVITPAPDVDTAAFERSSLDQQGPYPFEEFIVTKAPELKKRASTSARTVGFNAPDNVCGYVDGRMGAPLTCGPSATCGVAWNPASQLPGILACCDTLDCAFLRTCINSSDMSASCDANCREDHNTVQCTNKDEPYCYSFIMTEFRGATAYLCGSTPQFGSSMPVLKTSVDGDTDPRTWTPVLAVTKSSSYGIISSTEPVSSGPSTSYPPTPSSTPKPPSTVPAIAGGVAGGVLGLCAIGAIVFFVRRRVRDRATYNGQGHPQYGGNYQEPPNVPKPPPARFDGFVSPPPPFSPTSAAEFYPKDEAVTEHREVHYDRSETMTPFSAAPTSPTDTERRASENMWPAAPHIDTSHLPQVPQPGYRPAGNPAFSAQAHEMSV